MSGAIETFLNDSNGVNNLFLKEQMLDCFVKARRYIDEMKKIFDLKLSSAKRSQKERRENIRRLKGLGVRTRNYGRSLYLNRISRGCLACPHGYRHGIMVDVALRCNRKCFFCVSGDDKWRGTDYSHMERDMRDTYRDGTRRIFSIGNSEPLLEPERVYACLNLANELTKNRCYSYLYTNGDLLTEDIAKRMKEYGLDEIRISIKPGEWDLRAHVIAKKYIPNVMVEIPALPGDEDNLRKLLVELNRLDIFGINLCQLIGTRANKANLKERGYRIESDEYKPYYKSSALYEIPIFGSEETAFNVLEFAVREKIKIGVHYCSLENFRSVEINRRIHQARGVKRRHEIVTKDGLLKKLAVYHPHCGLAHDDLRKNGVPEEEIERLPQRNRVETHVKNIHCLNGSRYEIATVYSLPSGKEAQVIPCRINATQGELPRLPKGDADRLKLQIRRHIGNLLLLDNR